MPQQPAGPPAPAAKQPAAGRSSRSRGSAAEQQASTAEASEAEAESAAQPAEEAAEGDGGDDGILELQPHYQYISGLRCGAVLKHVQSQHQFVLKYLSAQYLRSYTLLKVHPR
jgi:hypothetical protein